jgi:hypothetical protein
MIISFTGHRDRRANSAELFTIEAEYPGATWVHGGAVGFDSQVDDVAKDLGKSEANGLLVVIKPDYARYSSKVAPIMRNFVIVDRGDILYALWDGRKAGGTYRTVQYAEEKCKPVVLMALADGSVSAKGSMR